MPSEFSRRVLLRTAPAGLVLGSAWLRRLAAEARANALDAPKSCILLWMTGGPSHIDTFDLKPEAPADVRGEFQPIETSVPGIQISEHFPQLSQRMQHAAVIRSMTTPESDHRLASYHVHTGYQQRAGGLSFPALGAITSLELGRTESALPNYVVIGTGSRAGTASGFLGQKHQPLYVSDPIRGVEYVTPLVDNERFDRQLNLLRRLEDSFYSRYQAPAAQAHQIAVAASERLMRAPELKAFDLSNEPRRDAYGQTNFGQGCLLARRLVEAGIPFIEVNMRQADWDTHQQNFPRTKSLSLEVDTALATLVDDLHDRGLLQRTLIIWMGEFGRSPQITSWRWTQPSSQGVVFTTHWRRRQRRSGDWQDGSHCDRGRRAARDDRRFPRHRLSAPRNRLHQSESLAWQQSTSAHRREGRESPRGNPLVTELRQSLNECRQLVRS